MIQKSGLLERHGFAHGFSLRTGGVSEGPFTSLNLGRAVGDDPAAVEENHRRFAAAVGFRPDQLFEVSQVHGSTLRTVGPQEDATTVRTTEADALLLPPGTPGAVGVRTADCIPLLLADPVTGTVSAVHAGWRGTVRRIVDRALDAFEALEIPPGRLIAAFGPHIRCNAFEVGEDVAAQIEAEADGEPVVRRDRPRPHVDLAAVVCAQLRRRGIEPERIEDVGGCTFEDPAHHFSYRRDGARSGRHLSVIAARND